MRLAFRRRKWLLGPLVRSTLPVPEMWKRFFAPLWVLSLGIVQLCNTRPCGLQTWARIIDAPVWDRLFWDGFRRVEVRNQTVWATGSAGFRLGRNTVFTSLAVDVEYWRGATSVLRSGFARRPDAGFGGEHHAEHTALHDRFLLETGVLGDTLGDATENVHRDLGVGLLTASEAHEDLDFGAVLEESWRTRLVFCCDIVVGDLRRTAGPSSAG